MATGSSSGGGQGGNAQFILEFKAEMKEIKEAVRQIDQLLGKFKKNTKEISKDQKKNQTDYIKGFKEIVKKSDKFRKDNKDYNKAEMKHVTKILDVKEDTLDVVKRTNKEQQNINKNLEKTIKSAGRQAGLIGGLVSGGIGLAGSVLKGAYNFTVGGLSNAYQQRLAYGQAMGNLTGLSSGKNAQAIGKQVRGGVSGAGGQRLGFSMLDAAQLAPAMARATGTVGPHELMVGMRGTGMGSGEVADMFRTIRQAGGTSFAGGEKAGATSAGGKIFQDLIAKGMASGLEKARVPEYLEGVQNIAEEQFQYTTNKSNIKDIGSLMAALGKSGLQGRAGAMAAGSLQKAILSPGGGEAGMAFMRQAMGFGKPGGTAGFYEAEKSRQQGLTSNNFQKIMTELQSQFGLGQKGSLALSSMTGGSLESSEKLIKAFKEGAGTSKIDELIKETEPLEKQAVDELKHIDHTLALMAGKTDKQIGIGLRTGKISEALDKMQQDFLEKMATIVEQNLPGILKGINVMSKLLDGVAGGIGELVDFLKTMFGKGPVATKVTPEAVQNIAKLAQNKPIATYENRIDNLKKLTESGDVKADQASLNRLNLSRMMAQDLTKRGSKTVGEEEERFIQTGLKVLEKAQSEGKTVNLEALIKKMDEQIQAIKQGKDVNIVLDDKTKGGVKAHSKQTKIPQSNKSQSK